MKVEVTDLKAPNDANATVADATGVQVKLWISSDSDDPIDTGAPDILVTDGTITGGVLSVPVTAMNTDDPAVGTHGYVGTNVTASTYATSTTLSFAHPGGHTLVFHSIMTGLDGLEDVSGTFDEASMTLVSRSRIGDVQLNCFAFTATAKTADIVITTTGSFRRRLIAAIPTGANTEVRTSAQDTWDPTANPSVSVTSTTNDLIVFGVLWGNSGRVVTQGTGQTMIVADDSPNRAEFSSKAGAATSTTVELTFDTESNGVCAIAVAVKPTTEKQASLGDPVLGVAKWTVATDDYFFPIDTTVQESV